MEIKTPAAAGVDSDPFWTDGTLAISANEQVEFLKRLYDGQLGLSRRTTQLTKEIIVAEEKPHWKLSAKTGACQPKGSEVSLWYVGYVEKSHGVHYFALQMGDKDYNRLFALRVTKARTILAELGVLR